jgi:hypothetical protein
VHESHRQVLLVEYLVGPVPHLWVDGGGDAAAPDLPQVHTGVEPLARPAGRAHLELAAGGDGVEVDDQRTDIVADVEHRVGARGRGPGRLLCLGGGVHVHDYAAGTL